MFQKKKGKPDHDGTTRGPTELATTNKEKEKLRDNIRSENPRIGWRKNQERGQRIKKRIKNHIRSEKPRIRLKDWVEEEPTRHWEARGEMEQTRAHGGL